VTTTKSVWSLQRNIPKVAFDCQLDEERDRLPLIRRPKPLGYGLKEMTEPLVALDALKAEMVAPLTRRLHEESCVVDHVRSAKSRAHRRPPA
jgi:hypothetical protein